MTTVINGEAFEDILQDRRDKGDLHWITAEWSAPRYQHMQSRNPIKLKDDVLCSQKVQYAIQQVSMEQGLKKEDVEKQAKAILNEMGHNQNLGSIRFIGYFLAKFMKRLYTSIYVSQDGIKRIRGISTQYPVLFMPTHRSYADFLLLSYVCFHYHIQTPIIAAGLDFLGLKALHILLRNCGAFYIRRSFGQDKLYWTIFTEYIQNILRNGDAPLEFFVEGTRSRSAKSLTPKLGMFVSAMELYLTGQVSDLTIVPISIAYDRTLEESLYAYELLGVPKPRESTRGFLKALKILGQNFGNIFFTVGQPVSVREFCCGRVDRSLHNLQPRFQSQMSSSEVSVCRDLANQVIGIHQRNLFLSPFPLVALVLGQELEVSEGGQAALPYLDLTERVLWLKELFCKTGAQIVHDMTSSDWLWQTLELHSNITSVESDGIVKLVIDRSSAQPTAPLRVSQDVLPAAVAHMYLYHYGNQALQLLLPFSMLAATLLPCRLTHIEEGLAQAKFMLLRHLLQKEFVFEEDCCKEDFSFALGVLRNDGLLLHKEGIITLVSSKLEKLHFLSNLLKPFLTSYRIVCQYLFANPGEVCDLSTQRLVHNFQSAVEAAVVREGITDFRTLSLDLLNNCLQMLICAGAVGKVTRNQVTSIVPRVSHVCNILRDIEFFLDIDDNSLVTVSAIPMSKL